MVHGDEKTASQFVQLAVNAQGIISGEYYNSTTDQTEKLAGAVDPETPRVAWTVADRKTIVYEAGDGQADHYQSVTGRRKLE